jgi:hypothetical protein
MGMPKMGPSMPGGLFDIGSMTEEERKRLSMLRAMGIA